MAASASDKLRKITNNFSTTLASGIGASDTTITLSSVTNLPTDTAVDLVIDRVDASGTKTPSKREYVLGVVSGSNLISVVRGKGNSTAQVHASGAVVEYVWDQDVYNDHVDNHLQDHNQAGNHKSLTDNNGNDWIKQTATTSAVNQVTVANAATGNSPVISATGTDTNVDLTLTPKGTGQIAMTKRYDGWVTGVPTFNTVVANGNRSYTCTVNSTDLTSYISAGMRVRTTRTVAAPTQCTSLDGTSQFFFKSSVAGMAGTDNYTWTQWIKPSSYPTSAGTIQSRMNTAGLMTDGWKIDLSNTGQISVLIRNGGAGNYRSVNSYQSVSLNKWTHIAVTWASGTVTMYFDGVSVPVAAAVTSGTAPTTWVATGNLYIGRGNTGENLYFPGKIAQAAVFSAVLSAPTIQGYISQGLTGSETSLISAYSFNNSINDLNTTNANNLTANGSAVATNADSPFGAQASGSISSTLDYGIITSISYSTNTTVVVQVPEGCTIPTTGGVSALSYSIQKAPYGMPVQRTKWSVNTQLIASGSNTPTTSVWYNLASFQLTIPTGEWSVGYSVSIQYAASSTSCAANFTISTSASAETDITWRTGSTIGIGSAPTVNITSQLAKYNIPITSTANTIYYGIEQVTSTAANLIITNPTPSTITAECAYL